MEPSSHVRQDLIVYRFLSHSIGPVGISVSDPFTVFTEQAISILRLSFDRMQPGEIVGTMQVDMGDYLFTLGRYIYRLGRDDSALRIKAKFCSLCEAVLSKPDCLVLSNDVRFRNEALEWLYDWSSEVLRVRSLIIQSRANFVEGN